MRELGRMFPCWADVKGWEQCGSGALDLTSGLSSYLAGTCSIQRSIIYKYTIKRSLVRYLPLKVYR